MTSGVVDPRNKSDMMQFNSGRNGTSSISLQVLNTSDMSPLLCRSSPRQHCSLVIEGKDK